MGFPLLPCLVALLFMSMGTTGQSTYFQPTTEEPDIYTETTTAGPTTQTTTTTTTTAEPSSGLPASPFFDVGSGTIPLYLDDGAYETIQLEQPFQYGENVYSQLYLNMDGYLAFFVPNINDEVPNSELGKDIIAPLWTDLDFSFGEKTYKQATSGPLIDQANQEINSMFPEVNFLASWVFVATWKNVPIEFSYSEISSFQVVLISDGGNRSFVLMNYESVPAISSGLWLAGYGMENSNFFTIPVINSYELPSTSNVNISGRWAFQITVLSTTTTTTPSTETPSTTPSTTPEIIGPCQTLKCTEDEVCRQINGAYGCGCGYIPTRNPDIYDAIETCSGSAGSLSLSRCQLFEAGYSEDVLHLNDPSCKGKVYNDRLVFNFDSTDNLCSTTLTSNNTHIIFQNNVGTIDGIGVISRSGGLNIAISCVYPLIQSISMPTDIQASGSVLSKDLSTEGSYQISIIPYTDATFLVPISGNVTLEVNHQMYIGVKVDRFDSTQIALVLDSCWATPFNQTDYSIRWDLIINECPNPNDGTVAVLQNGVSTSSNFSFRMFTFTGFSNKIFLHCQVHLCLQESGNCARNCNGARARKRRNAHFYDSAAISMEF